MRETDISAVYLLIGFARSALDLPVQGLSLSWRKELVDMSNRAEDALAELTKASSDSLLSTQQKT